MIKTKKAAVAVTLGLLVVVGVFVMLQTTLVAAEDASASMIAMLTWIVHGELPQEAVASLEAQGCGVTTESTVVCLSLDCPGPSVITTVSCPFGAGANPCPPMGKEPTFCIM